MSGFFFYQFQAFHDYGLQVAVVSRALSLNAGEDFMKF